MHTGILGYFSMNQILISVPGILAEGTDMRGLHPIEKMKRFSACDQKAVNSVWHRWNGPVVMEVAFAQALLVSVCFVDIVF